MEQLPFNPAWGDLDGNEYDEDLVAESGETTTEAASELRVLLAHSSALHPEEHADLLGAAREFQVAMLERLLGGREQG